MREVRRSRAGDEAQWPPRRSAPTRELLGAVDARIGDEVKPSLLAGPLAPHAAAGPLMNDCTASATSLWRSHMNTIKGSTKAAGIMGQKLDGLI